MFPDAEPWPFGHEAEMWGCRFGRVAGVDEAGRGPLAGPVVAAAVVFRTPECPGDALECPEDVMECPEDVMDSKALTPTRREAAYERIIACADWAVGIADVEEIDRLNILNATHLAMRRAVAGLNPPPDCILVDGLPVKGFELPCRNLIKGERQSASIAAASIIAKVTRDRMMEEMHARYPAFNFARHKGYGTAEHLRALAEHGPCPIHRASFAPVRVLCERASGRGSDGAKGWAQAVLEEGL